MKRLLTICLIALVGGAAAEATAQETLPAPTPAPSYEVVPPQATPPAAMPAPHVYPAPAPAHAVPLYTNVRVKDRHKIHPCAVPTIVEVADPCNCDCTVCIEICVPPCECVCVKRRGRRVEFDYGKYEIDVVSRRGVITVDYDT